MSTTDKTDINFQTPKFKTMKFTDKTDGQNNNTYFYGQNGRASAEHLKALFSYYGQNTTSLVRRFVRRVSAYLSGKEAIRTKPHPFYNRIIGIIGVYISDILYREKAVRSVRSVRNHFFAICTGNGGQK